MLRLDIAEIRSLLKDLPPRAWVWIGDKGPESDVARFSVEVVMPEDGRRVVCEVCGKGFLSVQRNARFCGGTCRQRNWRSNRG